MGDRCAIAILKLIDEQSYSVPRTLTSIIYAINTSFARPDIIHIKGDREPKVTLLLLSHLSEKTKDPEIRHQIEETIEFAKQQGEIGKKLDSQ